ncbi:12865_t:CDS:2 [Funneliformis geosporum]|uniref:17805_t:CDS:1 n=1 Tax=Funneliformis geosporum TaxID=1117311 RepID=A0A9W4SFH2_9GLOM|nr:12865_t:CDS:2 [Funneliformis geosporum]CAI2167012.1 17805_t:CDS:2 [Funneliformis geosporum]
MTRRKSTPKKQVESYFDAERILDEKQEDGKWYYLIKWSGHDKHGNPWPSNWEPKENCTPLFQEIEISSDEPPQNDVQDQNDKPDNEVQMNIDKPDDRINIVDEKINFNQLNQVLDKYCHINQKTQSSEPTSVKKDANNFHKIKFPPSKVKLVKINPIKPIIANITVVEHETKLLMSGYHSANKFLNRKKYPLHSQSGRLSLYKRGSDHIQDSNDNSTTKKQKTEIVPDRSLLNVPKTKDDIPNEESRVLQTTSANDKKDTSQSNKVPPSGNPQSEQSVPTVQTSNSTQVGAIHVNEETIKQAYLRMSNNKNASSSGSTSSTSSNLKFRPIAAKIAPATSQYTVPNVAKVNSSSNVGKLTGSITSTNKQNLPPANRLASIRTPVPVDNFPKSSVSATNAQIQSDKKSPQHTSYFHKSFVQKSSVIPTSSSNNDTNQPNQSIDTQRVSTPIKPPSTNDRSASSTMDIDTSSSNHPFYQLPLERLKEPTVSNIDLWMNEWAKAKSLNDTLEKEKNELFKEKNKYVREVHHLRLEVERRPQSESESSEIIKKYHESIQRLYNKWLETQNKYVTKVKDFTNLETEHSKLQTEYNQIKKLVMGKHTEGETLKGEIKKSAQELNELKDENKNLKADWSCLMRNGAIMMREDYCKITKLENSLQELVQQRSNVNEVINRLRKDIKQEVPTLQRHRDNPKNLVNIVNHNSSEQGGTNTNIVQARNVQTVKPVRNYHLSKLAEKPNVSANSKSQLPTNLRMIQSKRPIGGPMITNPITNTARRLNLHYHTETKNEVIVHPIPQNPTKSTQQMNYLCEWNLCKKLFSNKSVLKNHLKDHLNSGKIPIGKDKNIDDTDDLVAVKMEF